MINLDLTTRKLQAVLFGAVTANQLPCVVSYQDNTPTGSTYGTQLKNTNSTTAVDICDAPAVTTTRRQIMSVSIQNLDTAAAIVTVRFNDNGTSYTIVKVTLSIGDELQFNDGDGWKVITSTGAVKTASSSSTGGGGATGGGTDQVFYENDMTVTTDYTLTTNKNAMTAGPITINTGVTVTIPTGAVWTIP